MKKLLFALALVPAIAGFGVEHEVKTVEDLYAKVATAGDGDVINVAPGTYKMTAALGTLVINKGITVQSTGSWRDTFFEPETGLTDKRLLKIAHAKGLFKGFTLRNVTSTASMEGMAVYIDDPAGGAISDCRITNCSGSGSRYVVKMSVGSKMRRCRIDGNSATAQVIMSAGSNSKSAGATLLANCLIAGNAGTGLYWSNVSYLTPRIVNCTVIDNGVSAAANFSRESTFINCVLVRGVTGGASFACGIDSWDSRSTQYVRNCYFTGALPVFGGTAVLTGNVLATNPSADFADALSGDYRPIQGSALIGAGLETADDDDVDIDCNPRNPDSHTIGCFEYDPGYVPSPVSYAIGAGDDLASAIAAAPDGATVAVEAGTFTLGAKLVIDKPIRLEFAGRDKSVITGIGNPLVEVKNSKAVVSGVTIKNGTGVGLRIANGGGEVTDCHITSCASDGVSLGLGTVLRRTLVDENSGRGIYFVTDKASSAGKVLVEGCQVSGNRGGLQVERANFSSGNTVIQKCTIADNFNSACAPILSADQVFTFVDCVLLRSSLPVHRGYNGFSVSSGYAPVLKNCYVPTLSNITVSAGSQGNITTGDCLFVNPQANDYHLNAGSVLIGAASDGGEIGCAAFDAGYEPSYPVVNLKPGDDVKAAIDAAAEGTVVNFAEGEYEISAMITVDRPLHLVGAGPDKTILCSDGENHRILKIHNYRTLVEGVTFTGARCSSPGAAVWIGALGGCLANSRITDNVALGSHGSLAIGNYGIAYKVIVDGNTYAKADGTVGTTEGCAGINFWRGEAENDTLGSVVDHCLVCANRGYSLYLNNGNTTTPDNTVQNCTIIGQFGYGNVGNTRGFSAKRTIFLAATVQPFADMASCGGKVTADSCCYAYVGENFSTNSYCIVTRDPKFVNPRANDYHLRADSPCIGAASDGSDIGCYAYDPDYEPTYATVMLKDGDDLAAAVAAAEPGTDILLGAGTYELSVGLGISKPIRISGASRDSVFVQPAEGAGQFRLLTLSHPLARVENLTMRRSSGGCVDVAKGGTVENCRMTECACGSSNVEGLGARITIGYVNRCLVDNNTDLNKSRDTLFVAVKSNIPASGVLTSNYGIFDNSLVTGNVADNTNSSGHQWRGYAVRTLRANVGEAGRVRNVTVVGNSLANSLSTDEYTKADKGIQNCIFWGNPVAYSASAKKTGAIDHCYLFLPNEAAQQYATNCSTDDPLVRRSGKLKPSSPCIGQAVTSMSLSHGLDFAGNPRVREDGTQDIGCNQWMPSGLMLLVK